MVTKILIKICCGNSPPFKGFKFFFQGPCGTPTLGGPYQSVHQTTAPKAASLWATWWAGSPTTPWLRNRPSQMTCCKRSGAQRELAFIRGIHPAPLPYMGKVAVLEAVIRTDALEWVSLNLANEICCSGFPYCLIGKMH